MTTTPTIWKSAFSPNSQPAGTQSGPQSIGLANGSILLAWADDTQGPSPLTDVIAQLLTPEGIAIGTPFQINSAIVAADESGPKILALPDGGYVATYSSSGFIAVERFDADGKSVSSHFITDLATAQTRWEVTSGGAGNYTVVFERHVGSSIDIHSLTYEGATNIPGPERTNNAQNSSEDDHLGGVADFSSGRIVTFSHERDYDFLSIFYADTAEFTVTDAITGARINGPTGIAGKAEWFGGYDDAQAQSVASLTGGQFVMVYELYPDSGTDGLYFRICAGEAAGSPIGKQIFIAPLGDPDSRKDTVTAQAIGLSDGGFFVAWYENNNVVLFGQRFDANGNAIGALLPFATDVGSFFGSHLSLTADGRILVPYTNSAGEMAEVILDPRNTVIHGTAAGEAITTQTGSTYIYGEGGDDSIFGQAGNDRIYGGDGADTLRGGNGSDIYYLQDVHRPDAFSFWAYDAIIEGENGGIDIVHVQKFSSVKTNYTLPSNVEHGFIDGSDDFSLNGNGLGNQLNGNDGLNVLTGQAGNDYLDGGLGLDSLFGGDGNDSYVLNDATRLDPALLIFRYDSVDEAANGGYDTVFVNRSSNFVSGYTLGDNVERGIIGGVQNFNLTGNDLSNTLVGNSSSNILDGARNNDLLRGLGGNDTYRVDNTTDVVDEGGSGGTDMVTTGNVSIDLGLNNFFRGPIENATLLNNTTINAFGNALANALTGNVGANALDGALGNDVLKGLGGADTFRFTTALGAANIDTISDYVVADDRIAIDNAVFTGLAVGALPTAAFFSGAAAHDLDDRIIYNAANGRLYFDADGNKVGGIGAVQFATLAAALLMSASEFVVI